MMNKKGVSIGRIILYVIFFSLLAFLVYGLVVTFKAIKKPNNDTSQTSIRLVANNSSSDNLFDLNTYPFTNRESNGSYASNRGFTGCFTYLDAGTYTLSFSSLPNNFRYLVYGASVPTYNVRDNLSFDTGTWITSTSFTFTFTNGCYFGIFCSYTNGSSVDVSIINRLNVMVNTGSIASPYVDFYYNDFSQSAVDFILRSSFYYSSSTDILTAASNDKYVFTSSSDSNDVMYYTPSFFNNVFDLNYSINQFKTNSFSNRWVLVNGSPTYTSVYSFSNSYSVLIDCDIPVSLFNFSVIGSYANFTSSLYIKVNTDAGSLVYSLNSGYIRSSDILTGINSTATRVTSFEFIFYTSSTSTGSSYITYPSNSKGINDLILQLVFDYILPGDGYDQGYAAGYSAGRSDADDSLKQSVIDLNNQVNDLQSSIIDLKSVISEQQFIINNLQQQLNNASNNFKGLFFTIADVPFKTVSNVLGFEVLGVNLFKFFTGVLTALGILWLIKKIIK